MSDATAVVPPSHLNGQMKIITNPYNPAEILDQYLLVWFIGDPNHLGLSVRVDNGPETWPEFQWINYGVTDRAIVQIDSAEIPKDGYTHQITVHVWTQQGEQISDSVELKLTAKTPSLNFTVEPPGFCQAVLIRSGDNEITDMTQVEWNHQGAVKILAQYPEITAGKWTTRKRVIGFADHNEERFIVENLGGKFTAALSIRNVIFGVCAIKQGKESKTCWAADSVQIARRNPQPEINPDQLTARAINQTTVQSELYNEIRTLRGSLPDNGFEIIRITINQFKRKIKDITRLGGSVKLTDFGVFEACWNEDNTLRSIGFTPSAGFKEGVRQKRVMTDAEAKAE